MKTQEPARYAIPLLLIVLFSFIAFLPVLHSGFVNLDDGGYVLNNARIKAIHPIEEFSRFVEGNYHPLTMLAYAVQYQLFGLNPSGYHAVNLLFHLLNVVLVFYVVWNWSGKHQVALAAALLFGIHPMHVESVAWVSELKDLLYSFFFLASYFCYLRFEKDRKSRLYVLSLLLFQLALLSKAMAVSLPVVLVLTDYFKARKMTAKVWLEKLPFFTLSLVFGILAIVAQRSSHAIQDLNALPLFLRVVFASYGFVTYLVKLLLPYHLSAVYPYPSMLNGAPPPSWYYIYPFVLLALVAVVLYSLRFSRRIAFGFAFFAATVFLVLQLLPVGSAIMADRYVYIPSIAIFYILADECARQLRKLKRGTVLWKSAVAARSVVGVLLVAATYAQCKAWESSMTLWNDVIAKEDTAAIAYNNRGLLLLTDKRFPEALADFNKAISITPGYADPYQNRAVLFATEKRYAEALRDYSQAIRLYPNPVEAYKGRALLHLDHNRLQEALEDYNKVLELDPGYATGYNNRGNILLGQGKHEQALADYRKAVELDPAYARAYNGHGVVLLRQRKFAEATVQFGKALDVDRDYGEAYVNRALAEHYSDQNDAGCRDLQRALLLKQQSAVDFYRQWCQ